MHNLTLDEERDLAKKNKEIFNDVSVGTFGASDYHNSSVEDFFKFKEFYLNIVLEWTNGLQDQINVGKLPRDINKFIRLLKKIKEDPKEIVPKIINISKGHDNTLDLLTDPKIYKILNTKNGKEELIKINNLLDKNANYSFHRKDRYVYDWKWAKEQIQ